MMSITDDIKNMDLDPFSSPPSTSRTLIRHRTYSFRPVVSKPTEHPTKTCAAILKKLRALGYDLPGPDRHYRIRRVHAGHHQRSAGAWSWALDWRSDTDDNTGRPVETYSQIGSRWTAAECIKHASSIHHGPGGDELIPDAATRL